MISRVLYVFLLVATSTAVLADENIRSEPILPEPGNLRAQTYSTTAIELFWDRVVKSVLSYEITINGEPVQTNQGTSYFTDDLEAGQTYVFSVVAIDQENRRSATSEVLASTLPDPNAPTPPGPQAPSNISLVVYSNTAAELFWDRAPSEQRVVSTEISRNGMVIGMAEGNSFFDKTREPGLQYEYGLTAIDSSGTRSVTSVLIETTNTPIINRDNFEGIVSDVLATYFGDSYNDLVVTTLDVIFSSFLGEIFSDASAPTIHTCANGGTANFETDTPFIVVFSNCLVGDYFVSGPFEFMPGNTTIASSTDLTILAQPGTRLDFAGDFGINGTSKEDFYAFYGATAERAELVTPLETLEVEKLQTSFAFPHTFRCCQGPNFLATFSGEFNIQSSLTNGEWISASTNEDFNYSEPFETHSESWNYQSGILNLQARDNSRLTLNADSGNDATVAISLYDDVNGFVEEFSHPWSAWNNVLRRSPCESCSD